MYPKIMHHLKNLAKIYEICMSHMFSKELMYNILFAFKSLKLGKE